MTLNIGSWKDYASLSKHLYRQVGLNFAVSICCATMLMIVLLLADLRKRVHIVMASYFLDCGFPALDASSELVGFYQLVTKTVRTACQIKMALFCTLFSHVVTEGKSL